MTSPKCLCEQCKMTVQQCRERGKSDAVLDELWRFCLDNGVETREGLIGYRGEDGFLLLKILKKITELRSQQKGGGER